MTTTLTPIRSIEGDLVNEVYEGYTVSFQYAKGEEVSDRVGQVVPNRRKEDDVLTIKVEGGYRAFKRKAVSNLAYIL